MAESINSLVNCVSGLLSPSRPLSCFQSFLLLEHMLHTLPSWLTLLYRQNRVCLCLYCVSVGLCLCVHMCVHVCRVQRPTSVIAHSLDVSHRTGTARTTSPPPKSWDYKLTSQCLASYICNVRSGDQTQVLGFARQALGQLRCPESPNTALELVSADPTQALLCTAEAHLEAILPWRDLDGGRSWFST